VTLVKAVKRMLRSLDLPCLMATVDMNSKTATRFCEAFGFTFTGAMVDDQRIYVWQRPDHVYPSTA
jgi:RimJ/RimL family protein N-acetyltransferase